MLSLTTLPKETLMANAKLMKVMEYLINEQEDKAQELLHQIFLEKARAIHEEMMSHEDMEEDMLGGNKGDHWAHDIEDNQDEINAEEHYAPMEGMDTEEDTDDAVDDLGDELEVTDIDDVDDMDADDEDEEIEVDMDDEHDTDMDSEHADGDEERISDLEAAIEELKAEFEALKHEESGEQEHHDEMDADTEVEEAWESDMDESDDFDGLSENVDLDVVHAAKGGEVGSGKFARAETNTKSPVPTSQKDTMGAKPVVTGKGAKHTGYDLQGAPSSDSMGAKANRRKATDGMSAVSKEGNSKALLNKDRSEGFGAGNPKSPISGRVR
jgi:hypothetical protein